MSAADTRLGEDLSRSISIKKNGKQSILVFGHFLCWSWALDSLSGTVVLADRFGASVVPLWYSTTRLSRFGGDLGQGQWSLSHQLGPCQLCTKGQIQV